MNALAYDDYIDRPWLIFQNYNSSLFHAHLMRSVGDAVSASRPLDETTRLRLRWYPALASDLIVAGHMSPPDIEAVLGEPTPRWWAMVNHYEELAPVLEPKLLDDAESAERMIRWLRFHGKKPFHPEGEYLACLGDDPNRHFRLTPPADRPSLDALSLEASKNRSKHPGWAFLFVSCNRLPSLDPELLAALGQSEEYSYLTAKVLRRRNVAESVWQPLLKFIKSPRWAYHAMAHLEPGSRLDMTTRNRLLGIIHSSPPWAVQLWAVRNWRGDQLDSAYNNCVTVSDGHECAPELHSWWRMKKATTGKPVVLAVS